MKKRKCKICKQSFEPIRFIQPTCFNVDCQIEYANKHLKKSALEKKKAYNKQKKEFYQNDKKYLLKKAQKLVNAYVRLRDKKKPCISCGVKKAKWDAGHYKSAGGNPQMRFYTINIYKQCFRCNRILSSNNGAYRKALIDKIGIDKVEWIESNKEVKKYNIEYLKRLIEIFKKINKLYLERFRI